MICNDTVICIVTGAELEAQFSGLSVKGLVGLSGQFRGHRLSGLD